MSKKIYCIITIALGIRLLLLIFAYPQWHHGFLEIDLAQNILQGHGISTKVIDENGLIKYLPTAQEMPGYSILLSFFQWLTGSETLIYIQLFQILLDSLSCYLIYLFGRKCFSEPVGLIGATLFALYLPEAYLAVSPMRDVWITFCLLTALFLFLKYISSEQKRWLILTGLTVGVGCYFRPTVFFLPLFLCIPLWSRSKRKLGKSLMAGVVMQSVVLLCLTPWGIRNYLALDRFILTRTVFYQSIWEGFGEFANPFGAVLNDTLTQRQTQAEGFTGEFTSPEFDEFLKPKVIQAIREKPLWYLGVVLKRIPYALLLNRIPWGVLQDETLFYHKSYLGNESQKNLWTYSQKLLKQNPGLLVTKTFDALIFVLALTGIYLSRRQWQETLLILMVPLYFVAVHIPIHIEGRYMVPTHWVYLIFSAVTLVALKERLFPRVGAGATKNSGDPNVTI